MKQHCLTKFIFITLTYSKLRISFICAVLFIFFFYIELTFKIQNIFSCSGTFIGFFSLILSIKSSYIFPKTLPNGDKLPNINKYYMIKGGMTFGNGNVTSDEVNKVVSEFESNEIFCFFIAIIGSLISAFGQYLINVFI